MDNPENSSSFDEVRRAAEEALDAFGNLPGVSDPQMEHSVQAVYHALLRLSSLISWRDA